MKSDIITINNQGHGFQDAVAQTRAVAQQQGLGRQESLHLQLFTEEMLSMLASVTGQVDASFWVEYEGRKYDLHLAAKRILDKEERFLLISSTTQRKNEIAGSFLGRLRDAFEQAMAAEADHQYFDLPEELRGDVSGVVSDDPEWDGYERSVLLKLADDVKIGIRGDQVTMTVAKTFP